jgi:hypothetical protein
MSKFVIVAAALVVAGCASPPPRIATGPDAETTHDGLVRVDHSRFQQAWVDPTIDLAGYGRILVGPPQFQYRAARDLSQSAARRSSTSEFAISETNRQRLETTANEIFREELAASKRFTVTDAPGPDVLIVRSGLLDIVSRVPPEVSGRGDIYLDRVGEATLVLELVDSMSGEVLARAAERRAAERAGDMAMVSSSVTTWNEVRRLLRRWAVRLREGLDSFPPKLESS